MTARSQSVPGFVPLQRVPRHGVWGVTLILLVQLLLPALALAQQSIPPIATPEPRTVISLNGTWESRSNLGLACNFPPPTDAWKPETIPHARSPLIKPSPILTSYSKSIEQWKKEGYPQQFAQRSDLSAWYRKTFDMPARRDATVARVTFDCVQAKCVLWLNGQPLGQTVTGIVPTSFDLTPHIRWGQRNELIVWLAGVEALMDVEHETYLGQYAFRTAGITGDVRVEILPAVHVQEVYVNTSVTRKKVDVQMTLRNTSASPATITPAARIERHTDRQRVLEISSEPVTIPAQQSVTVTLTRAWDNPSLWSPQSPFLYVAACQISDNSGNLLDRFDQRFGFREFTIQGRQFLLNNQPITLLRSEMRCYGDTTYAQIFSFDDAMHGGSLRELATQRYNHLRVHGNGHWAMKFGDEVGVTLSPSLAHFWPETFPTDPARRQLWLPVIKEHLTKVVKAYRYHPSIVIWNLANETYWNNVPNDPHMKAICRELVDTVRAADPLRPLDGDAEVAWDGLLDIINIHYPGAPGELSTRYPNSGVVVPNDLYWLREKNNVAWRSAFDWNKPLAIGEYSMIPANPEVYSGFAGEDAFNWLKENAQNRGSGTLPHVDLLSKASDAYRVQGVAMLGPWIFDGSDIVPRFALRPLDFHPNFFSGQTASRKFVLYHDADVTLQTPRLECLLSVNDRTVWESSIPLKLQRGVNIIEVPITAPLVTSTTKAQLTLRLRHEFFGYKPERVRHTESVYLMPRTSLTDIAPSEVALLDPSGQSASALRSVKLSVTPLKTLDANSLAGKKLLIVAGDAPLSPVKENLLKFAEKGGCVLLLQRAEVEHLGPGFPDLDKRHVASRVWIRSSTHPALQGVDNEQLSYWRPDNLVSKLNYAKPIDGDFSVLLDAGGLRGLEWTPLCETPHGLGRVIFCQLNLLDRLDLEPAAGDLLARLIRHALSASPHSAQPLRVLTDNNAKLLDVLALCRLSFTRGLDGAGPVLWDASYSLTASEQSQMRTFVEAGGHLWLHGFTPETIARAQPLLPFTPQLTPANPKIPAAVRVSDSSLLNNLSSNDFLWAKIDLWKRGGYLAGALPTTKLGSHLLALPDLHAGTPLIEPGFLVEIPLGKGRVLFDSLTWETASDVETERVIRIVSALAMNQGARITESQGDAYDYFPIDLAPVANRGYFDDSEQGGPPGWLDMGMQDLCFFLTNHTERLSGTGAAVAGEPFPENVRFNNVPFRLTDPKKNHGKALIALRATDRGLNLPDKVTGISVNRRADKLWFIHAANYVPRKTKGVLIAKYVVHYDDQTTAEFPLQSGIDINDWSSPTKPEKARICWTGNNRVNNNVGLYLAEWSNPHPSKIIRSIDVIGAFTGAQLGVVGMAGGVNKTNAAVTPPAIARWDFADLKQGKIADKNKGLLLHQAASQAGQPQSQPQLDQLEGQPALKLAGEWFSGDLSKLSAFNPDKPFSITMKFSLAQLPGDEKGYGLIEAMRYLKSGMRVGVNRNTMQLWLETYPRPDGKQTILRGRTALEVGKPYELTLMFDDVGAKLYLDGKLEASQPGGLTQPYKGAFSVGQCSGAGRFFGVLKCVEIQQKSE